VHAPLDLSGAIGAAADASAAAARADTADVEVAVQDLRLAVTQGYWRAVLARAAVEATRHALDSAASREAELQSRVEVGGALVADLLRARTRRRQREAELAERENDGAAALALLARLMGTTDVPVELAEAGPGEATAPEGELDGWMARALHARTRLRAAGERTAAAGSAVRAARRTAWPGLALYGQVQDDRGLLAGGGGQWFAAGASVQWTPFDSARSRRQAAARAHEEAARSAQRAAEEQVRLEVTVAWRTARTAARRRAAAAGGTEEGREALRVIRERRQAGMATLTDELDTESALLAAELEELRASTEAALAAAALRRAAGELQ
jgi:outer membrane protein TolC